MSFKQFNEVIGIIGAICFAICGLPLAIQVVQQGHANGVSGIFLLLWLIGEIFTLFYVYNKHRVDLILILNYVLNLAFIAVIVYYKFW